ncbi:MAG: TetR/AcrR family transcriptional regulator [Candidatus Acinetobacter avistercoris]|uniref:TetR/AcrR family transcriptional regulator n=1 Tax=Acinetobacter sp. KS-LM10 TaxID=3120518 RepID=UPI001FA4FD9E|nr:TetR/AcrR family transcriptional regulator [Candidatus Acinetobacter avistercoris]
MSRAKENLIDAKDEVTTAKVLPKPRKRRANTEARHEDKRLLILKTAAELFATLGYEATSLDTIAEHVGIHKATLYHYITNKESILYECLQLSFKDLDLVVEEMKNKEICVFDRMKKFAVELALAQNNVFGRCLVLVGARPLDIGSGNEIKAFQRRLDLAVRALLEEGIADGKFKPCSAGLFSAMLFGSLNWVPRWYQEGHGKTIPEIADFFMTTLIEGIKA